MNRLTILTALLAGVLTLAAEGDVVLTNDAITLSGDGYRVVLSAEDGACGPGSQKANWAVGSDDGGCAI